MELVSGRTLEEVLTIQGPMSTGEATHMGIDLCHALAAVHRAGLLHRDIKAHNVLRESGGRIVLMDFGTGRDITGPVELVDSLAGTPLYLAPELFHGQGPSIASDVYSLGVLLYHLVTGQYPVQGSSRNEVELAHQRGQRKPLRDARPDLAPAFVDVVERALASNPKDRYASAGEFGDALAGVAGITYRRDGSPIPAPWRWKWPAAVAAGVLLAIVGVTRFDNLVSNRPGSEQAPPTVSSSGPTSGTNTGTSAQPPVAAPYRIAASFYAVRNGQNVRLTQGSRVRPGDSLFATIEASQAVFVYVINRDEAGQSYLLFPLPGYLPENPIPLSQVNHLPGSRNGQPHYWEVSSAGGREHFFVYVTPQRLVEFEQLLATLPRAELGRSVNSVPLSTSAIGLLRGVGGIRPADGTSPSSIGTELADLALLSETNETTSGVWARKVMFENPAP
jgi:serine/threonine protein kinase